MSILHHCEHQYSQQVFHLYHPKKGLIVLYVLGLCKTVSDNLGIVTIDGSIILDPSTTDCFLAWSRRNKVLHFVIERLNLFIYFFYVKRIMGYLNKALHLKGKPIFIIKAQCCAKCSSSPNNTSIFLMHGVQWFPLCLSHVFLHVECLYDRHTILPLEIEWNESCQVIEALLLTI